MILWTHREYINKARSLCTTYAIASRLGDNDKTIERLQRAYEDRRFLTWLRVDLVFDALRKDARFTTLLEKLELG